MERMRRNLKTELGQVICALLTTIVERAFGQIKQAQGFRHLLLRGREKVPGE